MQTNELNINQINEVTTVLNKLQSVSNLPSIQLYTLSKVISSFKNEIKEFVQNNSDKHRELQNNAFNCYKQYIINYVTDNNITFDCSIIGSNKTEDIKSLQEFTQNNPDINTHIQNIQIEFDKDIAELNNQTIEIKKTLELKLLDNINVLDINDFSILDRIMA
jgi:hypothetical protein